MHADDEAHDVPDLLTMEAADLGATTRVPCDTGWLNSRDARAALVDQPGKQGDLLTTEQCDRLGKATGPAPPGYLRHPAIRIDRPEDPKLRLTNSAVDNRRRKPRADLRSRHDMSSVDPLAVDFHDGLCYSMSGKPRQDRTTYVLVHGLGNSLSFWTAVHPLLRKVECTVAIDLPGFGRSRPPRKPFSLETLADELNALVAALGIGRRTLVAHSLGGFVALVASAKEPQPVDSLVLVSATPITASRSLAMPTRVHRNARASTALAAQFIGGIIPMAYPAKLLRSSGIFRRLALAPYAAHPDRLEPGLVYEALRYNAGTSVWATFLEARRTDIEALLTPPLSPVALITGEKDLLISADDHNRAGELLKANRTRLIPDCGHWPLLEQPHSVADFIDARTS